MKQRGFTLIELLVYIAISAIVATVAGTAWYNSTVFSLSSQKTLALNSRIVSALEYLERDMEIMGASANQVGSVVQSSTMGYMDRANDDRSTFNFKDNGNQDSISFRIPTWDATNVNDGYNEISYFVENNRLIRSTEPFDLTWTSTGTAARTVMENNVSVFNIALGTYAPTTLTGPEKVDSLQFSTAGPVSKYMQQESTDALTLTLNIADSSLVFGGYVDRTSYAYKLRDTGRDFVFTTKPGVTYTLAFTVQFNTDFVESYNIARDSVYLSIRSKSSPTKKLAGVEDLHIVPSFAGQERRIRFDFTTKEKEAVFQLHSYISKVNNTPQITISEIDVFYNSMEQTTYVDTLPGDADEAKISKMSTKSLKIELSLFDKLSSQDTIVRSSEKIINISNNGVWE